MDSKELFKKTNTFLTVAGIASFLIMLILFLIFGQEMLWVPIGIYSILLVSSIFTYGKQYNQEKFTKNQLTNCFHEVFTPIITIATAFLTWYFTGYSFEVAFYNNIGFALVASGCISLILEKKNIIRRKDTPNGYTSGTYLMLGLLALVAKAFLGEQTSLFYIMILRPMLYPLLIIYNCGKEEAPKYLTYCLDSMLTDKIKDANKTIKFNK
ncbi:MAG: hypothetical protein CL760_09065 [Chloroflexi bacterium]|nr:hypothetical protein [Chloroflexota bacterium]|tara:strand:- start:37393 stop:38025 length:633 start_codon:yes stop_codon:yes gene_type:complete